MTWSRAIENGSGGENAPAGSDAPTASRRRHLRGRRWSLFHRGDVEEMGGSIHHVLLCNDWFLRWLWGIWKVVHVGRSWFNHRLVKAGAFGGAVGGGYKSRWRFKYL